MENEILDLINRYWKFDNDQTPVSNWHDKQDLLEAVRKALRIHDVSGWVAVTDALPKALQTVWLTNGKGWCCLGCLIEDAEGWHWAESNGVIYIENGEIVSECESEDLDVNFWHELPKPPCH